MKGSARAERQSDIRVLGIDPGTVVTGFGIVSEKNGRLSVVTAGAIKTSARHPISKRLRQIFDGLSETIANFRPNAVAVENTFLAKNFGTALRLGQACGVALLAAELLDLKVFEYSPSEVKLAVVGHGLAEKNQVQRMVHDLLSIPEDRRALIAGSHHSTDALAVAICHFHSRLIRELAGTSRQSRGRGWLPNIPSSRL